MKSLTAIIMIMTVFQAGAPTVKVCVPSVTCGYYAEQCGVKRGYAQCEHLKTRDKFEVKL